MMVIFDQGWPKVESVSPGLDTAVQNVKQHSGMFLLLVRDKEHGCVFSEDPQVFVL